MSSIDSLAELVLYRSHDDVFKGEDGTLLADRPPVLAELYDYWQSRRRGQRFPARADIDPIDIPSLLEYLLLVDVLRDPLDFRYRLVGGHIVHHAGRNVQGLTVRDLMATGSPQEKAVQAKALVAGEAVAQAGAPIYIDLTYGASASDAPKRIHGVLLPLGEPQAGVNMVLGGLNYLA